MLAARLAQRGPLRVLDGGNRFNVQRVARLLAGYGGAISLRAALERIYLRRAFTCHQVITILSSAQVSQTPLLALDLLSTFYDESAMRRERRRLLANGIAHLRRLSAAAPVVVSLCPPPAAHPDEDGLLPQLQEAADAVFFVEETAPPPEPPRLF